MSRATHPVLLDATRAAGAVPAPADSPDAGVAWHYGDPFAEQRAAQRAAAVIDRGNRGVLALTGGDRLSWLHKLTSQYLDGLPDGSAVQDLNLDGQGRVLDHFWISDVDSVAYIDTEGARVADLAAYLTKMVFWADVQVAERPDLTVLTLVGPDAARIAGLDLRPGRAVAHRGGIARADDGETTLILPADDAADAWAHLVEAGAQPAGSWAYEALRVARAEPRLGVDTDEKTIPHEVGWIGPAVHLEKGCYRGQETIARVHNLGRPPRRLVLLHLDGSADTRPATGDPVTAGGRTVGRVGTVVEHCDYGPVALALVKRAVPDDAQLDAGGAAAAIDADVTPAGDGAVAAGRAAVDRLRGR
ncbi:folate-binding protein [Tsukamurella sp. 8F]|uniref:CAF17-like 4Fe-4S cluster assembly/insertion protein YgfZ n=1 Tax=unclassified Tsukamurella TaxID=2633480 RepID=UPI0023B8D67B|nr:MULTISPECIES: folate-binding protein [unclassified Tsukamurella]MDF0528418.1 folate-binding protein [Tsukamurella sp. 8J]MDF0586243.1 folate-binding protein [Tsukamurella sp. 8F]